MKNFLRFFSVIMLSTLFSIGTYAQVTTFPWSEDFENGGSIPTNWSLEYVSATADYTYTNGGNSGNPGSAHGGSYNALFYSGNYSSDQTKLITPVLDLSGVTSPVLTFWHVQADWGGDQDELRVYYKTSAGGSWVLISGQVYTTSITSWTQEVQIALPNPNSTYYIAFDATSGYGYGVGVDDVTVEAAPSCTSPSAQTETTITATGADLGWTDAAGSHWDVYVTASGGAAPSQGSTPTADDITSNPYTYSGGSANTTYDWYVRSDCDQNNTGTSAWYGPSSFFTGYCTPAPSSVDGSGITNVTFSTVDNSTGDESGHYGDYSAQIGNAKRTTTLAVDITYETGYTYVTKIWVDWNDDLDFDDAGEEVYSGTSSGSNPTTLNASFTIPSAAVLGNHRMRIGGADAGPPTPCYTGTYAAYEDYTINVQTAPSCPAPSAQIETNITLNSVDLGWTENGSSTTWNVEYGPTGFTQGTGTTVSGTTTNPYSLTGLTANTAYDWYVQADCGASGGTGTSTWTSASSFTTADGVAVNPTPADGADGILVTAKTLDWDDVTNATGYHISVGTTTGGTDIVNNAAISGASNSTYTVASNWSVYTTYYWTVTTDYNSGSSAVGNEWIFTSELGVHSFPLTEDFESGFTYFNNKSGNDIDFADETTLYHGGSHSVKNTHGSSNTNVLLETGKLDLSSTTSAVLEFWHIAKTEGGYDKCYVEISTNGGSTYTTLPNSVYQGSSSDYSSKVYFHEDSYSTWGTGTETPDNTWWKKETFSLSTYNVANVTFRFRLTSDGSANHDGWTIDDIHIYEPACPDPTAQTETNLTVSGADLGWTDASGSHWDVYVIATGGAAPGQGSTPTANDVASTSYTYSAGSASTTYDWYVRSDCDQNNTGTSTWVGPSTFTTLDGKAINPNPADNATNIAIAAKTLDWDDVVGATGYHITVGTTTGASDIINNVAISGGSNSTYTVASNWLFNEDYYWTVTTDFSGSSVVGDEWAFNTVDGKAVNPTPSDGASGIVVSSTILDWDDVIDATGYHISIGTTSGGTDIVNNASCGASSTYTYGSNWSYSTQYFWTVTTDYAGGTVVGTEWDFTTECGTYIPTYSEDFAAYTPACWTEAKGVLKTTTSTFTSSSSSWSADGFANSGTTGSARMNIYSTGRYEWLISPSIDLSGDSYQVEFDIALTPYSGTGAASLGVDDSVVVVISTDNGVSWGNSNALRIWKSGDAISNSGDHIVIDLSAYSTTCQIGFYATSTVSNEDINVYIDNFIVQVIPACPAPTAQAESGITVSAVDLGWTENGSATTWDIEYGASGYTFGAGTAITGTTTKPHSLTGLTGNTTYDWYVRADCGGSKSNWIGPHSFTTTAITSTVVNGKTSKCSPQFDRPKQETPPSTQYGSLVFYDKFSITVPTTGTYDILSDQNYDGYLHIYENSFDPANPLTNCIGGDDDNSNGNGASNGSKIVDMNLSSGTTYIIVGSGYGATGVGTTSYWIEGSSAATMPANTDHNGVPYRTYTVPTTDGTSRASDYECDDASDWTTYYDNNGTASDYTDDNIIFAIKKNGNNIGATTVTVEGASGASFIPTSSSFSKYVNPFQGWYVFNRYWNVSVGSQPSSDVDIRFYYKDADFNDLNTALSAAGRSTIAEKIDMSALKINDLSSSGYDPNPANGHNNIPKATSYNADGAWIYNPPSSSSTVKNAKWTDGTYGSDFYFQYTVSHFSGGGGGAAGNSNDGSLPIDLMSFNAFAEGSVNQIVWKTATEFNVDYFVVERMNPIDNKIVEIGRVDAEGNSNTVQKYSFEDKAPLSKSYYRIRNVDYDGAGETFDWVFVERNASDLQIVNLYPNPAKRSTHLEFINPSNNGIHIEILDVVGKVLLSKDYNVGQGMHSVDFDLTSLSAGTYYISVYNMDSKIIRVLVIE